MKLFRCTQRFVGGTAWSHVLDGECPDHTVDGKQHDLQGVWSPDICKNCKHGATVEVTREKTVWL